jgi:hypothetical protein
MIGDMERGWKEAVMALRYCLSICLKGLRKTTKTSVRIISVLARIQKQPTIYEGHIHSR